MTQRYDQDMILGYVEGELADDQRARFESLLEDDQELRQLVSQMKLDRQALRGLGVQPAPVGLIDQVIQTHERAALLGDPAAPDPLPLSMPVHRWKLRRVLAYSAVAAVLLLSFGLVLQTLIPPDLLNYNPKLAHKQAGPDAPGNLVPGTGSGLALLDEDKAHDQPDARSLSRKTSDLMAGQGSSVAAAKATAPSELELGESIKSESLALADKSAESEAEAVPAQADAVAAPASALAMKMPGTALDQDHTDLIKKAELQPNNAGPERSEGTDTPARALAEPTRSDSLDTADVSAFGKTPTETDRNKFTKDALADAFAGYSGPILTDRTQLLVNAPSPARARRDIRDWAIANSVRLIEDPRAGAFNSTGAGGAVAGRRSRTPTAATAPPVTAPPVLDDGSTRYVVVVDQQQVPDLLAYLNRARGQYAELFTPAQDATANEQPSGLGGALTRNLNSREEVSRPADDSTPNAPDTPADKTDTPKAVANRLVDTHSGWDHGSLARGISPLADSNQTGEAKEDQTKPTDSDHSEPKKQKEEVPVKQHRRNTTFDWSRLLEPRKPFSVPDASTREHHAQPTTGSHERVRLAVIIRQVADVSPADAVTHDASRADQESSSDTTE